MINGGFIARSPTRVVEDVGSSDTPLQPEIKLTLWRPEYTWAKLPFPISWSMTNCPMASSPFARLDEPDDGRSAMAPCEGWR